MLIIIIIIIFNTLIACALLVGEHQWKLFWHNMLQTLRPQTQTYNRVK